SRRDVSADIRFTGADVDGVWVRRGNCQGADRGDGLIVEYRFPGVARVARFPHAPGSGARIVGQRIAGDAGRPRHTPAAIGANGSELQELEFLRPSAWLECFRIFLGFFGGFLKLWL